MRSQSDIKSSQEMKGTDKWGGRARRDQIKQEKQQQFEKNQKIIKKIPQIDSDTARVRFPPTTSREHAQCIEWNRQGGWQRQARPPQQGITTI